MSNTLLFIMAIPILAISIGFHEMMHALTSDSLGDRTAREQGRLTLNPFKHIDPFLTVALPLILVLMGLPPFGAARPVPFNPQRVRHGEFGVALIALAGPLTNLVLAVIGASVLRYIPGNGLLATFLELTVQINIGFFVFNLIPFPPLDGSRILYAFAPEPIQAVMQWIEQFGLLSIAFFMFVLFPFIGPVMGNITDWFLRILS